jgi:type IV secretory pathway VirB2 component (pilin)
MKTVAVSGARSSRREARRINTLVMAGALGAIAVLAVPEIAHATPSGPSMPWDAPLQTLLDNLQGTVARILVTVAVVITGLLFAFGESGGAFRRVFGIAFGAAIALGALTVLSSLGFVGATF